jgi:D-alanine-D-alanine ligase
MKLRVAVIYGGRSGEHEVSIRSAQSIMAAMDPEKYKILQFIVGKDGRWRPRPILPEPGVNAEIDVVFPVLHGTFGEDGTVQGLLELADLPYVAGGPALCRRGRAGLFGGNGQGHDEARLP